MVVVVVVLHLVANRGDSSYARIAMMDRKYLRTGHEFPLVSSQI
jgi:hypothetical protein